MNQKDREKAGYYANQKWPHNRGRQIASHDAYLDACKAKDLEWQAKVQGLVSKVRCMLIEREACGYTLNHDERNGARIAVEMLSGAVKLLTSGESPDTVSVPTWTEEEILLAMQRALGVGSTKGWSTGDLIRHHLLAIKGIGEGG